MALETLKIFRELADEGKAIVLITHDIDLAFHIADRVAVFYAGTTLEIADAKDFLGRSGSTSSSLFKGIMESSATKRI